MHWRNRRIDFNESLINYRFLLLIIGCIICGKITLVISAPSQYCVEQTKDRRLVGVEPYAIDTTKELRQCIARCIKDNREIFINCKSVVYSQTSKRCYKYRTTALEAAASFERTHETDLTSYNELLIECPHRAVVSELAVEKRRDDPKHPLADRQDEASPPAEAPPADNDDGPPPDDTSPPHHHHPSAPNGGQSTTYRQQPPPSLPGDMAPTPAPSVPGPPQQHHGHGIAPVQPETYQIRPVAACCSPPQQTSCCPTVIVQSCCPAPQPQPCCPAPQPQPCCPAPQPQPCCPAPQPQPCCPAPQPKPCCPAPQPQPCCPPPTPQPQPCCPAPQPQPCCPAPQPKPCCAPPPTWGPWSAWSECHQQPCAPDGGGGTYQTRTRQCQGYGCQGDSQQQQPCGCLQGQWTEWGPPTPCSETCGQGMQVRSRTCTVPGTCQGQDTDQTICDQGPCCHWSEWQHPEPCPQTCGHGGMTVRRRHCVDIGSGQPSAGCPGPDSEPTPCPDQLPPCCQPWTPWSACSSTCGSGTQTRSMTCDSGPPSTEQQPCVNQQPCCSEWTPWGNCRVVCGQGYQTRTRTCGVGGGASSGGGGSGYLGPNTLGLPTLPNSQQGGCCSQQQSCSNGCSPNNAFYRQQQGYYGTGRKRK